MPTRYQGTPEQVRALDAYIKLNRAAEAVSQRIHAPLAAEKLTVGQFGVLEALWHLGPLSQTTLGEKLLRSGGNITMVVDNLEKRGLVQRVRSAQDRRSVSVHLTEAGRSLIERLFPRHAERVEVAMGVLDPEEQGTLDKLCRKLGLG